MEPPREKLFGGNKMPYPSHEFQSNIQFLKDKITGKIKEIQEKEGVFHGPSQNLTLEDLRKKVYKHFEKEETKEGMQQTGEEEEMEQTKEEVQRTGEEEEMEQTKEEVQRTGEEEVNIPTIPSQKPIEFFLLEKSLDKLIKITKKLEFYELFDPNNIDLFKNISTKKKKKKDISFEEEQFYKSYSERVDKCIRECEAEEKKLSEAEEKKKLILESRNVIRYEDLDEYQKLSEQQIQERKKSMGEMIKYLNFINPNSTKFLKGSVPDFRKDWASSNFESLKILESFGDTIKQLINRGDIEQAEKIIEKMFIDETLVRWRESLIIRYAASCNSGFPNFDQNIKNYPNLTYFYTKVLERVARYSKTELSRSFTVATKRTRMKTEKKPILPEDTIENLKTEGLTFKRISQECAKFRFIPSRLPPGSLETLVGAYYEAEVLPNINQKDNPNFLKLLDKLEQRYAKEGKLSQLADLYIQEGYTPAPMPGRTTTVRQELMKAIVRRAGEQGILYKDQLGGGTGGVYVLGLKRQAEEKIPLFIFKPRNGEPEPDSEALIAEIFDYKAGELRENFGLNSPFVAMNVTYAEIDELRGHGILTDYLNGTVVSSYSRKYILNSFANEFQQQLMREILVLPEGQKMSVAEMSELIQNSDKSAEIGQIILKVRKYQFETEEKITPYFTDLSETKKNELLEECDPLQKKLIERLEVGIQKGFIKVGGKGRLIANDLKAPLWEEIPLEDMQRVFMNTCYLQNSDSKMDNLMLFLGTPPSLMEFDYGNILPNEVSDRLFFNEQEWEDASSLAQPLTENNKQAWKDLNIRDEAHFLFDLRAEFLMRCHMKDGKEQNPQYRENMVKYFVSNALFCKAAFLADCSIKQVRDIQKEKNVENKFNRFLKEYINDLKPPPSNKAELEKGIMSMKDEDLLNENFFIWKPDFMNAFIKFMENEKVKL